MTSAPVQIASTRPLFYPTQEIENLVNRLEELLSNPTANNLEEADELLRQPFTQRLAKEQPEAYLHCLLKYCQVISKMPEEQNGFLALLLKDAIKVLYDISRDVPISSEIHQDVFNLYVPLLKGDFFPSKMDLGNCLLHYRDTILDNYTKHGLVDELDVFSKLMCYPDSIHERVQIAALDMLQRHKRLLGMDLYIRLDLRKIKESKAVLPISTWSYLFQAGLYRGCAERVLFLSLMPQEASLKRALEGLKQIVELPKPRKGSHSSIVKADVKDFLGKTLEKVKKEDLLQVLPLLQHPHLLHFMTQEERADIIADLIFPLLPPLKATQEQVSQFFEGGVYGMCKPFALVQVLRHSSQAQKHRTANSFFQALLAYVRNRLNSRFYDQEINALNTALLPTVSVSDKSKKAEQREEKQYLSQVEKSTKKLMQGLKGRFWVSPPVNSDEEAKKWLLQEVVPQLKGYSEGQKQKYVQMLQDPHSKDTKDEKAPAASTDPVDQQLDLLENMLKSDPHPATVAKKLVQQVNEIAPTLKIALDNTTNLIFVQTSLETLLSIQTSRNELTVREYEFVAGMINTIANFLDKLLKEHKAEEREQIKICFLNFFEVAANQSKREPLQIALMFLERIHTFKYLSLESRFFFQQLLRLRAEKDYTHFKININDADRFEIFSKMINDAVAKTHPCWFSHLLNCLAAAHLHFSSLKNRQPLIDLSKKVFATLKKESFFSDHTTRVLFTSLKPLILGNQNDLKSFELHREVIALFIGECFPREYREYNPTLCDFYKQFYVYLGDVEMQFKSFRSSLPKEEYEALIENKNKVKGLWQIELMKILPKTVKKAAETN